MVADAPPTTRAPPKPIKAFKDDIAHDAEEDFLAAMRNDAMEFEAFDADKNHKLDFQECVTRACALPSLACPSVALRAHTVARVPDEVSNCVSLVRTGSASLCESARSASTASWS
ncbi:hypothetical protein OAO87_02490 [bacterium]|nr:hypothetical protein [bacterium]